MYENFNDYLNKLRKYDQVIDNYDLIDKAFEKGDKRLIYIIKSFLEEKDRLNKLNKESETFIFKCFSLSLTFILTSFGIKSILDPFGLIDGIRITILLIMLIAALFLLVHFIYRKRELKINLNNLMANYFMNKYNEL